VIEGVIERERLVGEAKQREGAFFSCTRDRTGDSATRQHGPVPVSTDLGPAEWASLQGTVSTQLFLRHGWHAGEAQAGEAGRPADIADDVGKRERTGYRFQHLPQVTALENPTCLFIGRVPRIGEAGAHPKRKKQLLVTRSTAFDDLQSGSNRVCELERIEDVGVDGCTISGHPD